MILMHPVVKALVLLSFVAMTSLLGYLAISKTTTGFELVDLTPDKSYVRDFFNLQEEEYGSVVGRLPTALYFKDIRYSDAAVQVQLLQLPQPSRNPHPSFHT